MPSGECPIRYIDAEDIRNVLFTCERASEIWRNLGLNNTIEKMHKINAQLPYMHGISAAIMIEIQH